MCDCFADVLPVVEEIQRQSDPYNFIGSMAISTKIVSIQPINKNTYSHPSQPRFHPLQINPGPQ